MSAAGHVRWLLRLAAVTVLTGLGAGLGGVVVVLVLQTIQHTAFGYSHGTFAVGAMQAPPWRRVLALACAGILGGVGWYLLRRFARPVVPISAAVTGERMPVRTTLANVGLQLGIVGLGASIGREAAPRELGSLLADRLSTLFGLTARERRIIVAAGAGAGLAAVYNVPFGGALFTIEILLGELSFAAALPAFATAAIAAFVARLVVSDSPLYTLPHVALSAPLMIWALPVGVVVGLVAAAFVRVTTALQHRRPRAAILWVMPVTFTLIGVLSIPLPEVLGNGRAAAQTVFDGAPLLLLALLLLGKAVATGVTIGAGAAGGTLTPSIAIGAAAGAVLGAGATLLTPGAPAAGFALLGAGAFLAVTMRGPFTASVLALEFTGAAPGLLIPAMLAIAAAVSVSYLIERTRLIGDATG